MSSSALKTWASVHKWTSVVCTVFLLILCISGLPLLFEDEIEAWTDPSASGEPLPATAPHASLDPMVATAHRLHPGEVVTGIFLDPDAPRVVVHTAISREAANADPGNLHSLAFDAGSGALIGDSERAGDGVARLLRLFFALHTKLMLGTAGLVVVLAMGLLFLVAIVSGIVLYAPFTRRLVFGTVRRDRSARVRRLDTHNLVGVVTMAWALVVGFTGVLNELTGPLFGVWAQQVVAAEAAKWSGGGIAPGTPLASPQAALVTARKALPGMTVTGIDYPGASLNSARHYMLWARGSTPATAQLFTPVMVDAVDGRLAATLPMPWYLRAIEISRPFHFGNYGGLPLKLIWALFDIATIIVLVTGLQLWLRPKVGEAQ